MRKRTYALSALVLSAFLSPLALLAFTSHHTTPKPTPAVSAACQTAASRQNAYAQYADNNGYLTTYTNSQQLAASQIDGALVTDMVNAGCPETIRYYDMLTGTWVN
jgi:hypothetical protein